MAPIALIKGRKLPSHPDQVISGYKEIAWGRFQIMFSKNHQTTEVEGYYQKVLNSK